MQDNAPERPFARCSTISSSVRPADASRGAALPARRPAARFLPLLAAAALGGAALLSSAPASAQSKIAVVDVRRAMLETEEGLRVQATLKKLFDSRQVELDTKQRALADERDKLDKEAQAGKTPKDALQRRFETWQRQAAELQATMVDYQREMQRKESELTTPILQKVLGLLRRLAAQEGYDLILEKSAAPYYRADLELTDRAIQMYNSGQVGDAAPAKGAPPARGAAPGAPAKPAAPAPKPAAPPAKK
ncbi:OmpH family outer membrane protein [Sorangium sp. So ce1078]|uniref:OmpH family outer membrane protein n=1 Tax=Sorangium sp. So ce1078 TaxID=3133329 RepID=UPI003F5EF79B